MQKFDFVGEGPLGLELVDQKGEPPVVIKSIREGTQAETMGVQPNSVIVGINGQSADGMNRLQIVEALKVAGRPIHMLVLPSQALLDAKKAQDADAAASAEKAKAAAAPSEIPMGRLAKVRESDRVAAQAAAAKQAKKEADALAKARAKEERLEKARKKKATNAEVDRVAKKQADENAAKLAEIEEKEAIEKAEQDAVAAQKQLEALAMQVAREMLVQEADESAAR